MKAKSSPNDSLPHSVKKGSVTVPIYHGWTRANGQRYRQFTVCWYEGPRRVRRRFGNIEDAVKEAELAADKLAAGEQEVMKLTPADRSAFVQALRLLRPLEVDLNLAVAEYVEAVKLLPAGTTLKEAVLDFAKRQKTVRESKLVSAVVTEYIAAKEQAGRSERHTDDLRTRLEKFGDCFKMPVAEVTGPKLQAYLDENPLSIRSKLNEFRHIVSLLRFAVRRKYAPRDLLDEIEAVERPEPPPTETLIFTPDELREMFAGVKESRPEIIPWLTVAAFCGLRSAEILRLDWQQVNLKRRFVEVKALNAKTAQRRLVPLGDAAIAWLADYAKESGPLAHYSEENKFYGAIVASVNAARLKAGNERKFKWKRNGLRHSFVSYRLALTQDAARTALEAGNSATMVFRHYRELTGEDEAKSWFAVQPPTEANVVSMHLEAAAV